MSAGQHLQDYIDALGARLARRQWLIGTALLSLASLLLTLGGCWLVIRFGFGRGVLDTARTLMLLALLTLAVCAIFWPLRQLRRQRTQRIEDAVPAFDGRLTTFAQLPPGPQPLRALLAEDALKVAQSHAPDETLPSPQLVWPALLAALALMSLAWLAVDGPGLYRDSTRALWAGWLMPSWLPQQRIEVEPGDQTVRRGGQITLRSRMHGFAPAAAQLHAQIGSGAWQQVDMRTDERGFEFTLFSLNEPVHYYVSAAGVRSPSYQLRVVSVPNIDQLRLVYRYPNWTGKPATIQDDGGDISAIAGTRVDVQLHADASLDGAQVIVNDEPQPLSGSGTRAQASINVARDGHYYLAMTIGGERVRLSDDYAIKVEAPGKPEIHIVRPGRDYSASSIEEVTTHVQASDEYRLQSLELRYAVNGGAWQTVTLPSAGGVVDAQHVFELEDMHPEHDARALAPGDLISYYAVARDPVSSTQTDMYFIDVQPFDRRFSQSQAASGAGGGDSEQDQISQRQREILVSTWNLLRQQGEPGGSSSVHDNAALLSTLQKKLAAEAESLAERTQARELDSGDKKIATFVDSMKHAAQLMSPAAQNLAALQLQQALTPEQQALQYLMRAEAQFTDMQVSMQRGGGGGNQADRDLSQIYELEMDLKKNQYESGQDASPEATQRDSDELARRLQQLARREQQLAQAAQRNGGMTPEERWQQQTLQREAEELQRQLAQQASQASSQSQGSQSQSQDGQGQSANGAASGGGTPSGQATQSAQNGGPQSPLQRQLEQAIRAMQQAGQANGSDRDGGARAADDAQRALTSASAALSRARAQALQQSIAQLAQHADQLYAQQLASQKQLQQVDPRRGLTNPQRGQLAEQKRQIGAGVQQLSNEIASASDRIRADAPSSAQALNDAGQQLRDSDVKNRLDISAQYIALGRGALVAPTDAETSNTLRDVRDALERAGGVAQAVGMSASLKRDPVADELARVRSARAGLQRLADAAASTSAAGGAPAAQPGSTAASAAGSGASGEDVNAAFGAAQAAGNGGSALAPELRARGADSKSVNNIDSLARQLSAANFGSRSQDLTVRLRDEIGLLEQLDLQLSQRSQRPSDVGTIRAAVQDPVADDYQAAVAEYYRQLSRQ